MNKKQKQRKNVLILVVFAILVLPSCSALKPTALCQSAANDKKCQDNIIDAINYIGAKHNANFFIDVDSLKNFSDFGKDIASNLVKYAGIEMKVDWNAYRFALNQNGYLVLYEMETQAKSLSPTPRITKTNTFSKGITSFKLEDCICGK